MDLQQQLFTAALGIYEPTFISDVNFENNELHITLDFHRGGEFPCPICGELHKVYDTELKTWRHLNFFQFKCHLHFHTPRVNCPTCGKHRYQVPWSRPQSGFTQLFEAFVLTLAKSGMPISAIAKIMGENDTRLRRIIDFHVEEAYAKRDLSKVRKVCVDETSSKKGHKYITVFSNPKDKTVLFATPGKDSSTFVEFAKEAEKHGLDAADKITEVTIDMSEAFQKGAKEQLPKASVTFDRFHVIKLLNEAIDKVRRIEQNENKELSKTLKNSRYCWLKNQENLTNRQIGTLEKLLANEHLKTAEAYRLKMKFQDIYETCNDITTAKIAINEWILLAEESRIEPIMQFADTVKTHAKGITRFFKSRLTNGLAEGLNSLIGQVKRAARGYTNMRHFINMIYLIKGGLILPDYTTV